jgi:hypothetical protein
MMCSNCCRPGHNRLRCPTPKVTDAVVAEGIARLSWAEVSGNAPKTMAHRPSIQVSVPMMEDHVEAIRLRLMLLKTDELLQVQKLVEERISA